MQLQLKVFQDHRDEDFDEFAQRFDNIRLELDDVDECFELVKNLVMDTNAEPFFLSILQHMICIRDDAQIRQVLVHQIHSNGSFIPTSWYTEKKIIFIIYSKFSI